MREKLEAIRLLMGFSFEVVQWLLAIGNLWRAARFEDADRVYREGPLDGAAAGRARYRASRLATGHR